MDPNAVTFAMKRIAIHWIIGSMLALTVAPTTFAETVLYGGLGGHGVSSGPKASTNDGALVIVSQIDGSTTVVGHPAESRESPAWRSAWMAPCSAPRRSRAVSRRLGRISQQPDPHRSRHGSADLERAHHISRRQPFYRGSCRASDDGCLVRDTEDSMISCQRTASSTSSTPRRVRQRSLGDTGKFFASIAFAPDGTLYLSSAILRSGRRDRSTRFLANARSDERRILTNVATSDFYHSLAVRPTDGVIFGGTADQAGDVHDQPGDRCRHIGRPDRPRISSAILPSDRWPAPPARSTSISTGSPARGTSPPPAAKASRSRSFPTCRSGNRRRCRSAGSPSTHRRRRPRAAALVHARRQRRHRRGQRRAHHLSERRRQLQRPADHHRARGRHRHAELHRLRPGQLDYTFTDGSGRSGSIPTRRA